MEMLLIEIIGAVLLIVSCICIILLVVSQDSTRGLSQSLTGSSSDNYYQKNSGRTKDAMLKRATRVATIILFIATITVNVFAIFGKEPAANNNNLGNDIILGENDFNFEDQIQFVQEDENTEDSDNNLIGIEGFDYEAAAEIDRIIQEEQTPSE